MTTVRIDKEKVTKMVTGTLKMFHDSGAHPAEVVIALGEAMGRVISATGEMGATDVAQREMLDIGIKQITNAIIAARPQIEVPN